MNLYSLLFNQPPCFYSHEQGSPSAADEFELTSLKDLSRTLPFLDFILAIVLPLDPPVSHEFPSYIFPRKNISTKTLFD